MRCLGKALDRRIARAVDLTDQQHETMAVIPRGWLDKGLHLRGAAQLGASVLQRSELIEFGFRSDTRSRSETFIHFEDCRDATYSLNFARDLVRLNILPT